MVRIRVGAGNRPASDVAPGSDEARASCPGSPCECRAVRHGIEVDALQQMRDCDPMYDTSSTKSGSFVCTRCCSCRRSDLAVERKGHSAERGSSAAPRLRAPAAAELHVGGTSSALVIMSNVRSLEAVVEDAAPPRRMRTARRQVVRDPNRGA